VAASKGSGKTTGPAQQSKVTGGGGERAKAEAEEPADKAPKLPRDLATMLDHAIKKIRPYQRPIGFGLLAVVVLFVGASMWTASRDKKAGKVTMELGKVLETATARVEEGGIDYEALSAGIEPEPARFKTFKDRSEAELAAARALESTYGDSAIAKRAKLLQAGALYDTGKYDEAIAAYKAFLDGAPSADLAATAREGIGNCVEAKALAQTDPAARTAGLDEAGKAYAAIAGDESDAHYPTALYHQARLRGLKGDRPGAIELYRKILEKTPGPLLTEEVNERLARLDAAPKPAAAPAQ
jgi:predicted negative regulator of RcsB-dependent stress response